MADKQPKKAAVSNEPQDSGRDSDRLKAARIREENWLDLATHFKDKVQKRTSEVAFLHTKAGFLIAAGVVVIQMAFSLGESESQLFNAASILAIASGLASIVIAIVSMHLDTMNALNPEKMVNRLLSKEKYNMSREEFGLWLARSYTEANVHFNRDYKRKYYQQVGSAVLLVLSFAIITILKGIEIYV